MQTYNQQTDKQTEATIYINKRSWNTQKGSTYTYISYIHSFTPPCICISVFYGSIGVNGGCFFP